MYNNPYLYNNFFPYQQINSDRPFKRGLLSTFLGEKNKINWSNILNNTQKTLNVINQAIPVYYQVKPIYNNAKTMLRMANALKDDKKNTTTNYQENKDNKKNTSSSPVFFL